MFRILFFVLAVLFSPVSWGGNIDINIASEAELDTLPGIGPSKAKAIVDFRTQYGDFPSIETIIQVPGIGPATYANIKDKIAIGGAAPATSAEEAETAAVVPAAPIGGPPTNAVNINTADASTLATLPGIGAIKAEAIVTDREANGLYASCQDLARVTGIGPATVANIIGTCTLK